jgi:hypothetical protein
LVFGRFHGGGEFPRTWGVGVVVAISYDVDWIYREDGQGRLDGEVGEVDWNPTCAVYVAVGGRRGADIGPGSGIGKIQRIACAIAAV